ncbi:MAG: tryptophan--tRNA ligase [Bacteroidia bacterium]|nr:tryptophan--tRNA ligase [Bacteroidia bacterium]
MARILTGIQSTGIPHLGNILGAIVPGIQLSRDPQNECFFFIADFHSLTTVHDPQVLRENTYSTAAAWLAFGFDTKTGFFYRQSDIPEVTELSWFLSNFINHSRLELAHSFKDKKEQGIEANGGLFFYPVLMAADILLYDAQVIPVGKDQKQHIEYTRDICGNFNRTYGETLIMPEARIQKEVAIVPGTDGRKMSKSYGNTIDIFEDDNRLYKRIKGIKTSTVPMGSPIDPDTCTVFALFSLIANQDQTEELRKDYQAGSIGFGHAKARLFEVMKEKFAAERVKFNELMTDKRLIDSLLHDGAEKAGIVAYETLARVREKIGYNKFAYYAQ